MLKNPWFSYDLESVRLLMFLCEMFGCENHSVLYVFVKIDFEILTKLMVWERFRHARAAELACCLYDTI